MRAIWAAEKPWARYVGCGKPMRVILAAKKPWARCFGCGKTMGALFVLRKIPGRAALAVEKLGRALFWLQRERRVRIF